LIFYQDEDQNHRPSDLVTTTLLKDYGLEFNKCWKLIICKSCKEGLPLRSVPEHLTATTLSRWDKSIGKKAFITTNHKPIPSMKTNSAAAKTFIDQLVQSLINKEYILSKEDILDACSSPDWVKCFSSLPHEPVEGIAVFDGWIDNDSGHAGRNRRGVLGANKSHGQKKTVKPEKCFIQTFSETYPKFFPVNSESTRKEEEVLEEPELQPIELLRLEKSRLLSQIPSLGKSATDRRALLPIFVNSGIEGWLSQFDRSHLPAQFPQCPPAGKKSTPTTYTRLAKANLILFGEDMKALNDIHHSIRHMITNATP
jgi:hypothetical protein